MKPEDFTPDIKRAILIGLACHAIRLRNAQRDLLLRGHVNTGALKIIGKSLRTNEKARQLFESKEQE
jgi:hypothetical protein